MMRRPLGALLTSALAAAALGAAAVAAVPAAEAATGGPPVTAPDSVTVSQGNFAAVLPIKNDHDPDNDLLTICRLGTEHYKGLDVGYVGDEFDVQAGPNAKAGTYTFTYYTCDYSYLVPGTISVTVVELPDIKVTAPASRPGTIRIKNPFDFKIRFLYGSFREGSPDGKLLIGPKDKVVVEVERTKIDWIAFNRKGTLYLGQGHVKGIELSRGAAPSAGIGLPARLAAAWRAAH